MSIKAAGSSPVTAPRTTTSAATPTGRSGGTRGREGLAGWLFISPVVIILTVFLLLPALVALWVSVSNWSGKGSPLGASFVGVDNYKALLVTKGLSQKNLGSSLRNNMYYVILVVPLQTMLALGLAMILNGRRLKGKGFFRTAFYSRRSPRPSPSSPCSCSCFPEQGWSTRFSSGSVSTARPGSPIPAAYCS